jgi:hypothetical protein
VSWSAHLQHTATGLAIVFAGPVSRLDMSADVAQHLALRRGIGCRVSSLGSRRRLKCVGATTRTPTAAIVTSA